MVQTTGTKRARRPAGRINLPLRGPRCGHPPRCRKRAMRIAVVVIAAGLIGLATAGCAKESASSSKPARRASFPVRPLGPPRLPTVAETGPFAAGRKVYNKNGCAKCHVIDEKAGAESQAKNAFPRGGSRKDLTTVGADHERAWILDHVREPKIHLPQSRMPAYENRISDKDLGALADFLASQK